MTVGNPGTAEQALAWIRDQDSQVRTPEVSPVEARPADPNEPTMMQRALRRWAGVLAT